MGGDNSFSPLPSPDEEIESSLYQAFPHEPISFGISSGHEEILIHKSESGLSFGEFQDSGPRFSSINEAAEKQRSKVCAEVLRSYEELQSRVDRLEEAKNKILRKSDSKDLKARLKRKARRSCSSSQFTAINFVMFVVNGLSVLESMDSVEEKKKQYCQMIAANFNCPLLSFRDDKPVVIVTHGDLLSLSDRVKVRVYLGELLGVPPVSQVFDIPENNDSVTRLAIVDMLIYCLERANRNLPAKRLFLGKVHSVACLLPWMVLAIAILFGILGFCTRPPSSSTPPPLVPSRRALATRRGGFRRPSRLISSPKPCRITFTASTMATISGSIQSPRFTPFSNSTL